MLLIFYLYYYLFVLLIICIVINLIICIIINLIICIIISLIICTIIKFIYLFKTELLELQISTYVRNYLDIAVGSSNYDNWRIAWYEQNYLEYSYVRYFERNDVTEE